MEARFLDIKLPRLHKIMHCKKFMMCTFLSAYLLLLFELSATLRGEKKTTTTIYMICYKYERVDLNRYLIGFLKSVFAFITNTFATLSSLCTFLFPHILFARQAVFEEFSCSHFKCLVDHFVSTMCM